MSFMDIRNTSISARDVILRINKNCAKALAQTIEISSDAEIKIQSTAIKQAITIINAGKTPEDFIEMIEIVSQRLEEYARQNSKTWNNDTVEHMVKNLAVRYNALVPIALTKEKQGKTSSYDKVRHELVIENAGILAEEFDADPNLARDLAKLIADKSVKVQDQYLQHNNGPLAEIING